MKKIIMVAIAIVIMATNSQSGELEDVTKEFRSLFDAYGKPAVMDYFFEPLVATIPKRIDHMTTITKVLYLDGELQYEYKLDLAEDLIARLGQKEYIQTLDSKIEEDSVSKYCTNPRLRAFLKNGISTKHTFYDAKSKEYLFTIIVAEKNCVN